jgi:hypothetical protein
VPDSIRELLQGIAGDEPGPSRDLATGALKRARVIGRRRAAAIAAVTGLALASVATAAVINGGADAAPPPADDPTRVEVPVQETTTPPKETEEGDEAFDCGARPDDGEGLEFAFQARGDSDSAAVLTAIPDRLLVQDANAEIGVTTAEVVGQDSSRLGGEDDYRFYPAPDGDRVLAVDREAGCSAVYTEIGEPDFAALPVLPVETRQCPIAWSPDSNKVLFTEPVSYADAKTYMLDVSTGELVMLADGQGDMFCTGVWLPDSEHVWSGRTTVLALDGTVAMELPGLADTREGEDWLDAGISADGGEACFQRREEWDGEATTGQYCDHYVDTGTGAELDLPVDGEERQVVFLPGGSMLILVSDERPETVHLVGPDGEVVEERVLPEEIDGDRIRLVSYFTD